LTQKYTRQFPILWGHIREARQLVRDALAEFDKELRDAAAMTVSELLENALKYGACAAGMPGVNFVLIVDQAEIIVEVANGVDPGENVDKLCASIDALKGAPDKEALYITRVHELLTAPGASARLGLLRIGYEGGFELSYTRSDPIITITARRKLR
jgi:hypothetical protein